MEVEHQILTATLNTPNGYLNVIDMGLYEILDVRLLVEVSRSRGLNMILTFLL